MCVFMHLFTKQCIVAICSSLIRPEFICDDSRCCYLAQLISRLGGILRMLFQCLATLHGGLGEYADQSCRWAEMDQNSP